MLHLHKATPDEPLHLQWGGVGIGHSTLLIRFSEYEAVLSSNCQYQGNLGFFFSDQLLFYAMNIVNNHVSTSVGH